MVIVPAIGTNLFMCQYNVVVEPARHSLEQLPCYKNVSFGHPFPSNYKGLASLSNEIMENNWVVMQSNKVMQFD